MKEAKVKEEATAETAMESSSTTEGREGRLEKLSRNHVLASMGVALIPLPIVDLVALMGIQLKMVREIAAEYAIPFRRDIVKSTIFSLMGGVLPITVGCTLALMLKSIPLIGLNVSVITIPAFSGACTYAIYKVFVQHFESGGTFLDLDPAKVKAYYSEQFAKGKKYTMDLKTKEPAKTEA